MTHPWNGERQIIDGNDWFTATKDAEALGRVQLSEVLQLNSNLGGKPRHDLVALFPEHTMFLLPRIWRADTI